MTATAPAGRRPDVSDLRWDSEGAPQALHVPPPPITGNNNEDDNEKINQAYPPENLPQHLEREGDTDAINEVVSRAGSVKAQVLEWNVAEYKVKLRKGGKKTILQNVVGRAEAGTFNAILGPSGCGKTSLLDCLALRNTSFTGLDSVMGELICLLLHDLARRNPKRIVVVAVHCPSSRVFTLFSHLTILSSNDVKLEPETGGNYQGSSGG
eukprot:evm.model.NODE_390_length_22818_cov_35.022045.4